MQLRRKAFLVFSLSVCAAAIFSGCAGRNSRRLPVVKDTELWIYRGEPANDFGAAEPIFVEGAHYVALLGFDISEARGKKITAARLWLHRAGEASLLRLVISTVGADWYEGGGKGDSPDPDGSCAAYVKAGDSFARPVRWAGPGSEAVDVIMTNGNTLLEEREARPESGGWQSVEISLPLAYALVNGESYGLALYDGSGELRKPDDSFVRKSFNSRDSGRYAPYLEVRLEESAPGAPEPPSAALVEPDPGLADIQQGGVRVALFPAGESEQRGSHYELLWSAQPLDSLNVSSATEVPRFKLPRISEAASDTVLLDGLVPGGEVYVAARTVDIYGRRSPWVLSSGTASLAAALPSLTSPKRPSLGGQIRVWVCAVDEKVNPVNGSLLEENPSLYSRPGTGDYDYMYDSPIWNAAESAVTLEVARGGTAAFQVLVEPEKESIQGVSLQADWSAGPAEARGKFPVKAYRNWYLRSRRDGAWYPEVAVPLQGEFGIPDSLNAVEGQRNQSFTVEFYVPRDSRPGLYRGRVVIGSRGLLSRTLEVRVNAHEAVLPEKLPFISEMNVYSPMGGQYGLDDSSEEYYAIEEKYYRLAREHLCVINQLPYSQTGTIKAVGAPALEGEGESMHVSDWSAWDRRFGRYLDGSAFAGLDRGTPVEVMYLPFFENWPASLNKYYRFTPTDTTYIGMVNQHTLSAPPIGEAFDPAYEKAFTGVLTQFAEHFRQKGWTATEFQLYLNNKYYWKRNDANFSGDGISWWLLDEPYHWDDFKAIGWFGSLFMKAVGGVRDVDLKFRIDVSRPQLQFGLWDSLRTVSYVSQYFYDSNAYLRRRKSSLGADFRNYGAFNNLEESNLTATAWPLKVYLNGGSGLLPWQTIAADRNYESFENTAIFYPGVRFGIRGPLASLRLKAARQGAEDVTLLALLARKEGWTQEQTALAVAGKLDLGGGTVSEDFEDAGRITFGNLSPARLAALRKDLLRSLDAR